MLIVSEETCRDLVGLEEAFKAVADVFAAMASGEAVNFPVVREAIGHAGALYSFKSGFDRTGRVLGVKSGGYWPGNSERNLTNHQSSVFLFDPDTGRLGAVVGGNHLTAVRTAAAGAVSIAHLARRDSRVLGILGAGHQAGFQLRAAADQRAFEEVIAWNRHPENLAGLAAVADDLGLPFEAVERDELGARADVIITITSAFEPLLLRQWIKPGTHLACMGTDTAGKQEVDPELIAAASLFCDEIGQSVTIGECQHAAATGRISEEDITPIGQVVIGSRPGRRSEDEITLFDGTGVGLQDLAVASLAATRAEEQSRAQTVGL